VGFIDKRETMFSWHSQIRVLAVTIGKQSDNLGQAIGWILLGVTGGLCLDLCAKEILRTYSLEEFVLMRSIIGVVIFLAMAPRFFGGFQMLRTSRWKWHVLRSLLACGAMFGFFYGLSQMPLVNALTLGFTAPLMVTALSVPFLGEPVGWRRWLAVIVGFLGTLVILQPGGGDFSFASVAILIAAFCYACQAITARYLSTESILSLSTYVVVGPTLVALGLMNDGNWRMPDTAGWILMAGAGVCSVIAWIGFISGYRKSSPSILAPFEYIALIGGAIAGYFIWDEVPDRWVIFGGLIIISSGVYVVYREIGISRSAQ
jgi:drug/metabolite transporter (DMT)-like permease